MNKGVLIAALVIGAIIVVVMMRGGASGSQIRTLAPLPPGDSGDKLQAFGTVAAVASEQVRGETELALANVQAGVETLRINTAFRAVQDQNRTQAAIARAQSRAQSRSGFFDFLTGIGQTLFPFIF